jgi:hypothetical protein
MNRIQSPWSRRMLLAALILLQGVRWWRLQGQFQRRSTPARFDRP